MKEDDIRTRRQFFLWLAENMMYRYNLVCHESGWFELIDADGRTIAEFSESDGLTVY